MEIGNVVTGVSYQISNTVNSDHLPSEESTHEHSNLYPFILKRFTLGLLLTKS